VAPPRVYLAGPDVFLPDPEAWLARKQAICARHGLEGVSPLSQPDKVPPSWARLLEARRIALLCEAHIRRCDALVANLTPFRGVSADVGTAYELGFARALGRPVFGYSTVAADIAARTLQAAGARDDAPPGWRDTDGMAVERFGLADNLMLACAVEAMVVDDVPPAARWRDLRVFERCVNLAAEHLLRAG
jgi:nucleoside 2-deoxyribosyltransferase